MMSRRASEGLYSVLHCLVAAANVVRIMQPGSREPVPSTRFRKMLQANLRREATQTEYRLIRRLGLRNSGSTTAAAHRHSASPVAGPAIPP